MKISLRPRLCVAFLVCVVAFVAWRWTAASHAQSPAVVPVASVSAASYAAVVAPESIVATFGAGLAANIVVGGDTDTGTPGVQLPTFLGGVSVEVNGRSSPLFFVSPGQINFQVPPNLDPGTGQVIVRSDKGVIIAAGEIEIAQTAPAIFTANASGSGIPAAVIVRLKTNGQVTYEPVARFDATANRFVPLPLDLGPMGERVFLVLYLTGARRVAKPSDTRILVGSLEYTPDYIGASSDFVGIEQLNLELPRSLKGREVFLFTALGFPASNVCEIEIAPPANAPPSISGVSAATALAGERIEITGTGFPAALNEAGSEVLVADSDNKRYNAVIEEASSTRLRVVVPFGAGSGNLIVRTARGEAARAFTMRTSVSGVVQTLQPGQTIQQGVRVGLANVRVRAFTTNGIVERTTNADGAFLLPDLPASLRMDLEVDGTTTGLPYPKPKYSVRVAANRDNQFEGYLELKQATGVSVPALADGKLAEASFSAPAPVAENSALAEAQQQQVVFETNGSTATFPDGTRVNELKTTVLDPGRTPADLPPQQFSSTIVQITPFGARLAPGGKLTFPNNDQIPAGTTATLYRFDQTAGSATLGKFVTAGSATVTADGQRLETARNAVSETTYYFVSIVRPITTIYGSVLEEDGTPARGALVQVRGQSIFALTSENGSFILPNVPLVGANELALEVSYLRADGTVDRTERNGVRPTLGALTFISPPIVLPGQGRTRAPVILAPKTLAIEAGQNSEFSFLAYARVAGRTLRSVTVSGASFASVVAQGNDRYTLRLTPAANVTGSFPLTLSAIDSQGLRTDESLAVEVRVPNNTAPIANSQSVTTNEDTPVNIALTGSGGSTYRITIEPGNGTLSGTAPNLTYTPIREFNGSDGFSFTVSNGATTSAPATVAVAVRTENDAPRLDVAAIYTTNIGQPLNIVINGTDPDAGQTLTLTATGLPTGATLTQMTATSWLLSWTPKFDQLGSYAMNLTLRDDSSPAMSDSKVVTIVVDAKWVKTSQLASRGSIFTLFRHGEFVFASMGSGKSYRSADNGITWLEIGQELDGVGGWAAKGSLLFVSSNTGFYRSSDQGLSWEKVNSRGFGALVAKNNDFFATSFEGVVRSSDEGRTWIPLKNQGLMFSITTLMFKDDLLLAGTYLGGVYRSTDNGNNWTAAESGVTGRIITSLNFNNEYLFAGSFGGGVYRSNDGGINWSQVVDGLSDRTVNGLAVKGRIILAGTDSAIFRSVNNGINWERKDIVGNGYGRFAVKDDLIFAGAEGTIFRTADDGISWVEVNNVFDDLGINALLAQGNGILAGTDYGVYRTNDDGASWAGLNRGQPVGFNQISALAAYGSVLLAGTRTGIYRSPDNGSNWQEANEGFEDPIQVNGRPAVKTFLVKGNLVFVGTQASGVFRSSDSGATWKPANEGLGSLRVFTLHSKDGVIYAGVLGQGIFRTSNDGDRWEQILPGLNGQSVYSLLVKGDQFYALTDRGIYRSLTPNGERWAAANNGIRGSFFREGGTLVEKGNTLFATLRNSSGVYRSNDDGANWTAFNSGLESNSVSSLAVRGDLLFAGNESSGGVYVVTETPAIWAEANVLLPTRFVTATLSVNNTWLVGTANGGVFRATATNQPPLIWFPTNQGLPPVADVRAFTNVSSGVMVGLAGQGVYFSIDQGRNWTARNTGLTNQQVNALATAGTSTYAATNGGVFRTDNAGQSWAAFNSGLTRAQVLSLAVSGNTVYAGTDNGLFRSTNQGVSWTAVNTGLSDLYIVALGFAPDGTSLLAATSSGLFRSTNQGASWTPITQGLPERVVALTFAQQGRRLLAGTVNGFFVSEDNGVSWRQINGGLLSLQVGALAVSGDTVLAGTRSGGVFVSTLP